MRKFKIFICIVIGAFLFANIFQRYTQVIDLSPLSGLVVNRDTVRFHFKDWFEGSFQSKVDAKIKNNYGLSRIYIRINNQIAYSFFDKARANDIVLGKDNYMYEQNYINAYYGSDYIGEDAILKNIRKLKVIHDSLEKHNKHLLLVFCPGKASYYPEFIPDDLRRKETQLTNMRTYIKLAENEKLNYLNFYDMFLQQKNSSKHILYPKYGIHWSEYGEYLVFEKLRSTLKNKFNLYQPEISLEKIERSTETKGRDMDIIDGLNLLFKPKSDTLSYPILKVVKNSKSLPNAVVISDSFYWGIFGKEWCDYLFNRNEFWYYFKEGYTNKNKNKISCHNVDLKKAIATNDVFIIMATEATIFNFGWGAIDALYNEVTLRSSDKNKILRQERIAFWKDHIKKDSLWLNGSKQRAHQKGISVDSSITLDAQFQTDLGN